MNKKVLSITIIYILIIALVVIIDYCDISFFITSKLNYNYLSIFTSTLTTIYLFLITYFLIDKKISDNEKEKKNNKLNALFLMLNETYMNCKNSFNAFNNEETLKKYILPKVDFNLTIDPFIERQKLFVFKYDNKILEFVSDGIVDKYTLKEYINIKETFNNYINTKVALYDIDLPKYNGNKKAERTRKELQSLENKIKKDIEAAINRINRELRG